MIEESLYREIVNSIPIICVDGFVFNKKKQILLLIRNNTPAKGEWWVPGGRVLKNEKLDDAIKRKMKEEIGLSIENYSEIGIAETIFEDKHTINVCFKVDIEEVEIYLTDEHSKFEWFNLDGLPVNLNKILKSKIMETISVSEK